jgi:hypothetical protein
MRPWRLDRESYLPQESRDGYLVGLALAEAVHEEDLRREQEGLRTKTAAERDGEKGFCVRTWLRRSMVRPLPLWVAKKRM